MAEYPISFKPSMVRAILADCIPATPDPESSWSICPACVQNASAAAAG